MSDTHIENAIIQAIEIIADKKFAEASFDKTYVGIVSKVVDQTTGKYEVKYQDSVFTAYATSPDIYFQQGQEVYFLVPRNNMDNRKSIIGAENQNATSYQEMSSVIEKYNRYGTNIITNFKEEDGRLSSYKNTKENEGILYTADSNNNKINIDEKAIENYVKLGNGLAFGFTARTTLADSQVGGEYGVKFLISFKDAVSGEDAAVRQYVVGSKDVIGNPFSLIKPTEIESFINDINIEEFNRIQQISIFNNDFPLDENKEDIYDIFISDIRLYAGSSMTDEELNGYSLHIDSSTNGTILDNETKTVELIAQLKVKGKIITQDVKYYWFRQNGTIFRGSEKFSNYAGDGWECLNYYQSEKIAPVALTSPNFKFNTFETQEDSANAQALANQKVNKILCVAVYEGQSIKGQITVLNNTIKTDIIISTKQSLDAIQDNPARSVYYLDNGSPTLTCKVTEREDKFNYTWSVIPARGRAEEKKETTEDNELFEDYKTDWISVQTSAEKKDEVGRTKYEKTNQYLNAKNNWSNIKDKERIEDNKYINFPINSINGYSKIVCAITSKEDGTYKGSGSIVLYNKTELEGMYSLSLENGTQVFQYDEKGNSPASPQLKNPMEIKPLTFTLIDNTGKEIPHEQIKNNGYIKWIIPNTQTMLLSKNNGTPEKGDTDLIVSRADLALPASSYDVYLNNDFFNYGIENRYDIKKNINYIWLHIKFKDLEFDAYTDFTFPKDGDPGTNGTDYVVKISSPYDSDRIYISEAEKKEDNALFDDYGNSFDKLEFLVYNNSVQVVPTPDNVVWSCPPKGAENDTIYTSTYLERDSLTGKITLNAQGLGKKTIEEIKDEEKPINIVRATTTIKDLKHYAEIPICYVSTDSKTYRIKITPKTGYKYVVYSQDGSRPDYDNTMPFKVYAETLVDQYWETIDSDSLVYSWDVMGNLSIVEGQNTQQCTIVPGQTFDGQDLSSAIFCSIKYKENNTPIGFIHIPIYMMINRYGHKALNDWDGNSIQLNDKKDIILSPQVGAGSKDENNTFTGVLMGDIKESSETKTGLVGYHEGQRSIFLDANTGNAQFGKQGAAQIKITASSGQGTIQSGDYSYPNGKGMKIKFSEDGDGPYIRYGSGHFSVDENGNITAQGGGKIAGWDIGTNKIYKDNVGMASSNTPFDRPDGVSDTQAFYANNNFYATHKGYLFSKLGKIGGWNITSDRISSDNVGLYAPSSIKDSTIAFYAGEGQGTSHPFYVTYGGYLRSTSGQIAGWKIGTDENKNNLTNGQVGLGTYITNIDALSGDGGGKVTAKIWSGSSNTPNFAVSNNGYIYSKAGKIGGWIIGKTSLSTTGIILNSDGTMGHNSKNPKWTISADGKASFSDIDASGGNIGNWTIDNGALTNSGRTLSLDKYGNISGTGGTIGGVKITSSGLESIDGSWYIYPKSAYFTGLIVNENNHVTTSGSGGGISGSGVNISGSGVSIGGSGSTIWPKEVGTGDGKTWEQYINLRVQDLVVNGTFTYDNHDIKLKRMYYLDFTPDSSLPGGYKTNLTLDVRQNGPYFIPTKIVNGRIQEYQQINTICAGQGEAYRLFLGSRIVLASDNIV